LRRRRRPTHSLWQVVRGGLQMRPQRLMNRSTMLHPRCARRYFRPAPKNSELPMRSD